MTKIKLIAAMSWYRGIGRNNQLPWNHKKDLDFFYNNTVSEIKKKRENNTYQNAVFMGTNTFNSLPKLLKYRDHIVISRKPEQKQKSNNDVTYVKDIKQCIDLAKERNYQNLWCIGGSQIYEHALREVVFDEIKLTFINHPYDCDTYLPDLPDIYYQFHDKTILDNGIYISFLTYKPRFV